MLVMLVALASLLSQSRFNVQERRKRRKAAAAAEAPGTAADSDDSES